MFDWLIKWLFWNWSNYDWIDSNYYNDIHKYLTKEDINNIINKLKRRLSPIINKQKFIKWEKHQIKIKFLSSQMNNWCISAFITVTNHYRKVQKSFHWIFKSRCWNLKDYWVYEFVYKWKNKLWYDDYEQDKEEKCYMWHWSKKNRCY